MKVLTNTHSTLRFFAKAFWLCLFSSLVLSFLTSCASSSVSRTAANNVDIGVQNVKNIGEGFSDGSFADTYANTSQTTKGAVLGGTAGLAATVLSSGSDVFLTTAIGAVFGGAYGAYIDKHSTPTDRLINRGVLVTILGDQILIVVPSARIFYPLSANIKPDAYPLIKMLARYLNRFVKTTVNIAVYTSASRESRLDFALSQQEAHIFAKYLAASGLDSRLLYSEGYGNTKLVLPSDSPWDSDNYRIEITLEKLPV